MLPKRLLVLDVETTGLSPVSDSIIELAACVLDAENLEELSHFHSMVFSQRPISASAFRTHGLTQSDIAEAPPLHHVIKQFAAFAPDDVLLCGHNVSFDAAFLRESYRVSSQSFNFDYHLVDIWSVAFFVLGARGVRLSSYNLNALCSLYGIERDSKHSALQDVRASTAILRHLYGAVRGSGMEVLGQFNLFR